MIVFGVPLHLRHTALWFLAVAIVALPWIRQSYDVFWSSLTLRPLTVSIALIFIALSLACTKRQEPIHGKPLVGYLLGVFFLAAAISTINSSIPWQGMVHWFEMASYALAAFFLYQQLQAAPWFKGVLSFCFILALTLIIARLLFGWISVYDPRNHPWAVQIAFVENIRHLGYWAAGMLPIAYSFLLKPYRNQYWLTCLYLTLAWALVFWMGGRASFLALVIATLIFFWFYPRTIIPIVISATVGLILSQIFMVSDGALHLFRLFHYSLDGGFNQLSSLRLELYQQAITLWWFEAPLWGLGADIFRFLQPSILGDFFAQPHSLVVQTLLSFGLIGGCCIALLLLMLAKHFITTLPNAEYPGITIAACAMIATGFLDGVFYHSISFFYAGLIIAMALAATPKTNTIYSVKSIHVPVLTFMLLCIACYSLLSWQISAFRQDEPSSQHLKIIQQYPLYVEPSRWISHARSINDDELMHLLAELAAKESSQICFYRSALPYSVQYEFNWCLPEKVTNFVTAEP